MTDERTPVESPRDCVLSYPQIGDDTALLVGYAPSGAVAVEFRCKRSRITAGLLAFLHAFSRHDDRTTFGVVTGEGGSQSMGPKKDRVLPVEKC